MIRGRNISKFKMTKYLLRLDEKGSIAHLVEKKLVASSGLEYLKVKKFIIEPHGVNVGFYSIDGEVVQNKFFD